MGTSAERADWRRRWLGPLLVVGAAATMAPLATDLPSERQVELRFAHPERPSRVVLSWMDGDELVKRSELAHAAGLETLHTSVQATDGSYLLELTVIEGDATRSSRRRVVFDDEVDNVTIPVE